ncbi:glycosyltransferase family 2 protein [Patescibacteria group bacterium]
MKKIKNLTAVVLTKNEAENLPRCLGSLGFVGQILVVDDGSSDETLAIAQKFKAKVVKHKLKDFSSQRNFAISKVATDWTLMIDADEEVSTKLAFEIVRELKKNQFAGFRFRRKNFIFGRWVRHSGWYPDWQAHLFLTKKAHYQGAVHEQVEIRGKVKDLQEHLLHYNFKSLSHFLSPAQFDLYAQLEADQLFKKGYSFKWPDLVIKPVDEFLRRFFAEKGYLDGPLGLLLASLQSFKELVIYAYLWEKQSSKKEIISPESFLSQLKRIACQKGKELGFWLLGAEKEVTKSSLKKIWLRVLKKVRFW